MILGLGELRTGEAIDFIDLQGFLNSTLTTGTDQIPGLIGSKGTADNSGDDTIIAGSVNVGGDIQHTLGAGDQVDGGAGTDRIEIRHVDASTPLLSPFVENVENWFIQAVSESAAEINMANVSGAQQLWTRNSTEKVDLDNIQDDAILGFENTSADMDAKFAPGALKDGNVDIAIIDSGEAPGIGPIGGTAPGDGPVSLLVEAVDADLTGINVLVGPGDSAILINVIDENTKPTDLTVTPLGGESGALWLDLEGEANIVNVDGTAFDGGLHAILDSQTGDLDVKMGAGNDTTVVTGGTLNSDDSFDGGAGDMDTLAVRGEVSDLDDDEEAVVEGINTATNYERLLIDRWDDGANIELDASLFSFTDFLFDDTHDGSENVREALDDITVTEVGAGQMFHILTDVAGTASFAANGADALGVSYTAPDRVSSDGSHEAGTLKATGFDDVNLMVDAPDTDFARLDLSDETTVTVTGEGDLDVNGISGHGVTIDLTGFAGNVRDDDYESGEVGEGTAGLTDGGGDNTFLLGAGDNIVDMGEGRDQATANTGSDIFVYDGNLDSSFWGVVEPKTGAVFDAFVEVTPSADFERLVIASDDDVDADNESVDVSFGLGGMMSATLNVDISALDSTSDNSGIAAAVASALDGVDGITATSSGAVVIASSDDPNVQSLEITAIDLVDQLFDADDEGDIIFENSSATNSIGGGSDGSLNIDIGFTGDAPGADNDNETVTINFTIDGGATALSVTANLDGTTDTTNINDVEEAIAAALNGAPGVTASYSSSEGIISFSADNGSEMEITSITTTDPLSASDTTSDFAIDLNATGVMNEASTPDTQTEATISFASGNLTVDDVDSDNESVEVKYTLDGGAQQTVSLDLGASVDTTSNNALGAAVALLLDAQAGITAVYNDTDLEVTSDADLSLSIDSIIFTDPGDGLVDDAEDDSGSIVSTELDSGDAARVVDFSISGDVEAGQTFEIVLTPADGGYDPSPVSFTYTAAAGDNANTVRNALVDKINALVEGDFTATNGTAPGTFTVTDANADNGGFVVTSQGLVTTVDKVLSDTNRAIDTITDFDTANDKFDFSGFYYLEQGAADNIFTVTINSSTQEELDAAFMTELGADDTFDGTGRFALVEVLAGSGAGTYLVADADGSGYFNAYEDGGKFDFDSGDTVIELVGLQGTLSEDNFILSNNILV